MAKHAHATTVAVTVSYMDDVVSLDVRDDGIGLAEPASAPAPAPASGGFGLTAMRQRVEGLSGVLAVESERGGGTTIAVSIPVASPSVATEEPSRSAGLPASPAGSPSSHTAAWAVPAEAQ